MIKLDFCLCKNKGADQHTAQLISGFVFATQIVQFLFCSNQRFKFLAFFCDCTCRFVSELVGNPEDQFCHFKRKKFISDSDYDSDSDLKKKKKKNEREKKRNEREREKKDLDILIVKLMFLVYFRPSHLMVILLVVTAAVVVVSTFVLP